MVLGVSYRVVGGCWPMRYMDQASFFSLKRLRFGGVGARLAPNLRVAGLAGADAHAGRHDVELQIEIYGLATQRDQSTQIWSVFSFCIRCHNDNLGYMLMYFIFRSMDLFGLVSTAVSGTSGSTYK